MTTADFEVDCFLNELEALYRKYNMSIAHEDTHGAFILRKFREEDLDWLKEAHRAVLYGQ